MNPLQVFCWRVLGDLRPIVRYSAERFPSWAPRGLRARTLAHLAAGNPVHTLAVIDAIWACLLFELPVRWLALAVVVAWALAEAHFWLQRGSGDRLSVWREAWRFRRRWPAIWAEVAAKTASVQAEVGTANEPTSPAALRPIADHPKLGWWPKNEWPVVWWWVGPPPGRSLDSLAELAEILTANITRVAGIHIDYDSPGASWGRLIVIFEPVLNDTTQPAWATALPPAAVPLPPAPAPAVRPQLGSGDGSEATVPIEPDSDPTRPAIPAAATAGRPALRVIQGGKAG